MKTRRHQGGFALIWWLLGILVVAGLLLALWIWGMLSWSYSTGERVGWVQKLSKKGWLCKTWEGEIATVSLPGALPEKALFTVRDDETASQINAVMGRPVALYYEEHILLPTTCFGETRHFVTRVRVIDQTPTPMAVPSAPGAVPAPAPTPAVPPDQAPPLEQKPAQ